MTDPESNNQKEHESQASIPCAIQNLPAAQAATEQQPYQTEQKIEERVSTFEGTTTLLTKIGIFVGVVTRLIFAGQLWEMYEAALRRRIKPAGYRPTSPEIETEHSCPNCKSGPAEIYERSLKGEGWICRACNHTWLVPRYCPVVPFANSRWTYAAQNTSCPACGSTWFEYRTYRGSWDDADTHCAKCGKLIHPAWEM
jgi:ribosomal protein L37AE/L43A